MFVIVYLIMLEKEKKNSKMLPSRNLCLSSITSMRLLSRTRGEIIYDIEIREYLLMSDNMYIKILHRICVLYR